MHSMCSVILSGAVFWSCFLLVSSVPAIEWLNRFRSFREPKLDALDTEIARGKKMRRDANDASG